MKVNAVFKGEGEKPNYATILSSGLDLTAQLNRDLKVKGIIERLAGLTIKILPKSRVLISTGLFLDIPKGYEAQVRPKSGNSWKLGLGVALGTIDADYTGEIKVNLSNNTNKSIEITHLMEIAQLVIAPVCHNVELNFVDDLNKKTDRGENGFGHTSSM